jgi:protein-tyrosine phosphatase
MRGEEAGAMLDRVLIVCVGNICRSPMAEGLLRAKIRYRPNFQVSSAGVAALVGHPADPTAVALMAEKGIDISAHRARQVTPELLAAHDLVLVMEKGHEDEVYRIAPHSRGKVHRIGKFGNFDVPDPYRRERAAFEDALALIERGIGEFQKAIWPNPVRRVQG